MATENTNVPRSALVNVATPVLSDTINPTVGDDITIESDSVSSIKLSSSTSNTIVASWEPATIIIGLQVL